MTVLLRSILLPFMLLANACFFESDQVDTHGLNSNSSNSVAIGEARITSVDVVDDQLIIKGSKLSGVKSILITGENNFDESFEIESKTDSQIIANGLRNISFAVDSLFNLMIADAHGSSIFQIALGIENGSITANKLSSMGAVAGQVLKYDGTEWKPETLSAAGLNYSGNWNATSNSPNLSVGGQPGEYHIVTTAGSYDLNGGAGTNSWSVGDWVVWNDSLSQWEKIDNAVSVTSFNGRSGPVTPSTNDYTWAQIDKSTSSINDIADVDTSGVSVGQVLKWDGSKWAVANDEQSSGAGSVGSTEIADGSITDTDLAGSISQSKITNLTSDLSAINTSIGSNTTAIGNNSTSISANTSAINGKQDALIDGSAGQFLGTDGSGNFTFQTLTKAMIGLTNVDNVQQLPMSYLDNDANLAADSDFKVPTQKAIKAYVDNALSGAGGSDNSNADNVVLNADNDGSTAGEVQLQINGTNQVTIANNGNVGIGSARSTPASKLDVDGTIRATEICDETGANCRDLSSAASSGDITAVNTTAPLSGGNTSGTISLSLNYDDSTIGVNGSSELEVKDNSITNTKLASGLSGSKITTGTIPNSVLNTGTSAGNLVLLETGAKLPAVDGSQLTNLPSGAPSGTAGGDLAGTYPNPTLANIVTAGTFPKVTFDAKGRITAGASLAAGDIPDLNASKITAGTIDNARLNTGTGAGNLIVLDASSRLPAVDGSQLTNLPTPSLSAANIPNLDASKITTGTFPAARIPSGTDSTKLPLVGGTLSGPISMGTNKITGLSPGTASTDAATYGQLESYVDASTDDMKTKTSGTYSRDSMSLEALREQIDVLKSELTTVKTNQGTISTNLGTIQSDVSTIQSGTGSYSWTVATSDITLAVGNAYAVSGSDSLTLTLPAACAAGETIQLNSGSKDGFRLDVATGQKILFNGLQEALRVKNFTQLTVICVDDNNTWLVKSLDGDKDAYAIESLSNTGVHFFTRFPQNGKNPHSYSFSSNAKHICARFSHKIYCWGDNSNEKLGDGTSIPRIKPSLVQGLTSGVTDLVYGLNHTCALDGGAVKCWGLNSYGQIGDGTTTQRNVATQVVGLESGVTKIIAGAYTNCAIQNGIAKCWGQGNYGNLGHGSSSHSFTPVVPTGLESGVTNLFSFSYYSNVYSTFCAVKNGGFYCWGANNSTSHYPAGIGTAENPNNPTILNNLGEGTGIKDFYIDSYGYSKYVLTNAGRVFSWGYNNYGQLGQNHTSTRSTPYELYNSPTGYTELSIGRSSVCGLQSGAVKCWGYNPSGQIGDGTTTNRALPTQVSGLTSGVQKVITGGVGYSKFAITSSGALKAWGANSFGQLGDGSTTNATTPVDPIGLSSGVSGVYPDNYQGYGVFVIKDGTAYAFGINTSGQLGLGTSTNVDTPTAISGMTDISGPVLNPLGGGYTFCATPSGVPYCWGNNTQYGILGISDGMNRYYDTPQAVQVDD